MNITITGPRSVGKTSVSKLLAKKLKLKYISSDDIGERALKKQGGLDKAIKSGIIKEFIKKNGYNLITDVYRKEKNLVINLPSYTQVEKDISKEIKKIREKS
ncbi:(d)CMP kinase [Candidatus Pacearchaeota archaeon]|nr:(d)CMP kinase [Candidatus Pacearchaeota archaeon]